MIKQISFFNDANLGIYGKACDKFCLVSERVFEKYGKEIEEALEVKVFGVRVYSTELVGLFVAFNSNGIILPKVVEEEEAEFFRKIADKMNMEVEILNSKFTALGNLILCNDKGAIISKVLKKESQKIKEVLKVETKVLNFGKIKTVGSAGIATNKGCLLHRDLKENIQKKVEKVLRVKTLTGTANFGSPYVGSCLIGNSFGLLVSQKTSGYELGRILEALGL